MCNLNHDIHVSHQPPEHIISLTGLLARDKHMPMKVEVPLAVAIPIYRTVMSS